MRTNKRTILIVILLSGIVCLLAACKNLPWDQPVPTEGISIGQGPGPVGEAFEDTTDDALDPVMEVDDVNDVLSLLPCTGYDFLPPTPLTPNGDIVDPTGPLTFTWEDHCHADQYTIWVTTDPDDPMQTIIQEYTVTPDGEWTTDVFLYPMITYYWRVSANTSNTTKPSYYHSFSTGPICSPADLVAPILISPADGTTNSGKGWGDITEVELVMEYPYPPVCTPESFIIFVADNPGFTGKNYNAYSPAGFQGDGTGSSKLVKDDTNSLNDCTTYFWRAWAVSESTNGPFTEAHTFYTDFEGVCLEDIIYRAHIDANCRSNPWIANNEVGIMWEGDSAKMLGRNEDGWWGKFLLDNGLMCWVHMGSLDSEPEGSYFNPMLMDMVAHDPKPEPASEGSGGDDQPGQPVTACLVPSSSNTTGMSWECVSPCPNPIYASNTCKP